MSDSEPDLSEAVVSIPLESMAALGMEAMQEYCAEAGLEDFSELVCADGGCIVHVETAEPLPTAELRSLPYVAWWEHVETGPGGAASVGKLIPAVPEDAIDPAAAQGVAATEHTVEDGELTISMVGDRADLAEHIRDYEAAGASPTVERLGTYGGDATPLGALTDRQETVLREAHEQGYFEVPREATTADVAAALDLDDSTVAEHLQRAQRSIVGELLGEAAAGSRRD